MQRDPRPQMLDPLEPLGRGTAHQPVDLVTAVEQKLHVARTASEPKVEVAFADEGYPQLLFGVKVWAYDERDAVKRAMRIIARGLTGVAGDQARGLTFPWGRTKITVVT